MTRGFVEASSEGVRKEVFLVGCRVSLSSSCSGVEGVSDIEKSTRHFNGRRGELFWVISVEKWSVPLRGLHSVAGSVLKSRGAV